MADIKAGVLLSLKDQFSHGIKGAGAAAKDFGSTALGAVDRVNKAFSGLAGTLGALGVTIGVGAAVKTYIDLDERMVRIGTDLGLAADKTNELKRSLYEVARDPSIKMGTDSLLEAMETFSGKNFDADVIQDNLREIGLVMKATGATGEEAANFFIESFKRGMNKDEIMKSLDDISVIGDELHNQFSLSDFTRAFSGLEATNTLLGKSAMNTTELFTAMNILGAGTKSSARAVSAYNAIVNELADPRKQELLWKLGIAVREGGAGDFRNLADILKEIAATDEGTGNFDTLSTVFSGAAMDAIFAYNQFGNLADGLEDIGDTTGEIEKKAASNAATLKSNLINLQTAFMGFADKNLTGPLEKLTEFLNKLAEDPERVERYIRNITIGIAALGAVKIGAGIVSFIANLKGIQGGKIDLAGAAGGGAGIPVHVTNWGGAAGSSLLPGGTPGLPGASVGRTPAGRPAGTPLAAGRNALASVNGKALAGGAAAGGISAAVVAIPQMMGELDTIKQDESLTNKQRGKATGGAIGDAGGKIIGGAVGGAAGIAAGAAVGAAVGSVVPVLGTAVGALVGAGIGALGMWAGSRAGRAIGEGIGEAVAKEDIPQILADEISAVPAIPQGGGNPVLEGSASMDINVLVGDDRTRTFVSMGRNTLPVQVNTGSAREARENLL
jgi:phage tail tape-measure protein